MIDLDAIKWINTHWLPMAVTAAAVLHHVSDDQLSTFDT